MMKLITTPGPATFFATIPATKYIPVPTQLPTPRDVKSNVVRHFWKKKISMNILFRLLNVYVIIMNS